MEQRNTIHYRFGAFLLDTGTRELRGPEGQIPIAPKELQALILLIQARGKAVPRDRMIAEIWPDSVVGDTSLGRIVSVLRRHLGSESILSVAKFGYRFSLDVEVLFPSNSEWAVTKQPGPSTELAAMEAQPSTPVYSVRRKLSSERWFHLLVAGIAVSLIAVLAVVGRNRVYGASTNAEARMAAGRWDDMGVSALREGTYFKASKEFEQAVLLNPTSNLAHAHLAEAWNELEMVEAAKNEILLADNRKHLGELSALERRYVEAIRATIVRDYPAAVEEYQAVLTMLPEDAKSKGLEDLGRAYQRQGKIQDAIAAYKEAANREPSNAGVLLHLGLLNALQRNQDEANGYLDRATKLYEASTNLEGIAEVHYQRAAMAYVRAAYPEAESEINISLDVANRLSDPQLEARAYSLLSMVERWDGKLDLSVLHANRSLEISTKAGWNFGRAKGVMLLANVAIAKHDLPRSQQLLQQAFDLANEIKSPRLIANAEFSIADLADQTGDYRREITYGQRAAQDYRSYGSVDGVSDATMLVIQGEAGNGDLQQALRDAETLLSHSEQTHSDLFAEDSEAEIGQIYTLAEEYPAALQHYRIALDWSRKTGSEQGLNSLYVAESLARMGRIKEASTVFGHISTSAKTDPDSKLRYRDTLIAIEYGEAHYKKVVADAGEAINTSVTADAAVGFLKTKVMAELLAHQKRAAIADAEKLMTVAQKLANHYWLAEADLTSAMVEVAYGSPQNADRMACLATSYFQSQHMRQSSWLALYTDAEALGRIGRTAERDRALVEAKKTLEEIRNAWPDEDVRAYLNRADIKPLAISLAAVKTLP